MIQIIAAMPTLLTGAALRYCGRRHPLDGSAPTICRSILHRRVFGHLVGSNAQLLSSLELARVGSRGAKAQALLDHI